MNWIELIAAIARLDPRSIALLVVALGIAAAVAIVR